MILKNKFVWVAFALFVVGLSSCDEGSKEVSNAPVALLNQNDSLSYSIGMNISQGLQQDGIDANIEVLAAGLRDSKAGTPVLTQDQAGQVIMAFQMERQRERMAQMQAPADPAVAEANAQKGQEFLAQNKSQPGVIQHESGLQYRIDKEGSGAQPQLTDQVVVHYKGTLLDGSQFDSSYDRGEPATFQPMGLIRAWQIILPMMKEGAKYTIWSPGELAYGAGGSPPKIGPNETLVFEMELLQVIAGQ